MVEKRNLIQRLIAVRASVGSIEKDGKNEHFKFKFVSSAALLQALHGAMNDQGILLIPSVVGHAHEVEGKQILTHIDMKYTWVSQEDPADTLECMWYGQGIDQSERGVGKAYTYLEKYFLLKFFSIPTEDDPDKDGDKGGPPQRRNGGQKQRGNSGPIPASDAQRKMVWGIAKSLWGNDAEAEIKTICEEYQWDLKKLTGGRGGTASQMITKLQALNGEE